MIDSILDYLKSIVKSSQFSLVVTYIVLFSILVGRMFYLQIVKGQAYDEQATLQMQKKKTIKSARGKIYDSTGKLLATNEQSYAITLEDSGELSDNASKNAMILKCIRLIEKNGDKIDLEFPITITKNGKFRFTVSRAAELRFKREIYFQKSVDALSEQQKNMTAEECFQYIRTSKNVNSIRFFDQEAETGISDEDALKIMTVRYALMMNTYSKYEPITLSSNVCDKTVAAIEENSADLPGVEVSTEMNRVYYDSKYFSHVIGYTGTISSETLEEYKDKENSEYAATDQIGKTGIEKEYEDILKGEKGSETLLIDSSSRIVDTQKTKDAVAGQDVYLSINADLQKATYKLAEKQIASILTSKLVNSRSHGTRGKKASGILVSIYDVYDAIIQNSIVDVTHFTAEDATEREKSIYKDFITSKKTAVSTIKQQLSYKNKTTGENLSKAQKGYLQYIFSLLKTNGILDTETMNTADDTYNKYVNDKISLSEFLIYAIKNNWINLKVLNVGEDYYSSEEVFQKIVDYVIEEISDDNTAFDKEVYHVMVEKGLLSGRQICLLLFDQKVLKKNETTYAKIRTGMISPYNFLKSKIRSLEIPPGDLGLTPCACSVVITSVKTGKVLSLVSYPGYDNNKFANTVDNDYYAKISTSSASPLMNRATQQKAAPGSTFKMVTATTALEEGIISPYDQVHDNVVFEKINKPWPKCWSTYSHGNLNVTQAIQHSCNYFFYEMGYRLGSGNGNYVDNEKGLKRLKKYASKYGLTSTSGIELSESEPTFSTEDIVRSCIGQGTNSYTPVQMSRYVTTVANGTNCYDLTLIDRIVDAEKKKEKKNSAKIKSELEVSDTTLSAVRNGMYRVVNNGNYSSLFQSVPVKVAGKTGTAEITPNEPNHAWFVSFAPFEDPEISVTVQIPNGFTSANAIELASKVYRYYFDKKSRKSLLNQKVSNPTMGSSSQMD